MIKGGEIPATNVFISLFCGGFGKPDGHLGAEKRPALQGLDVPAPTAPPHGPADAAHPAERRHVAPVVAAEVRRRVLGRDRLGFHQARSHVPRGSELGAEQRVQLGGFVLEEAAALRNGWRTRRGRWHTHRAHAKGNRAGKGIAAAARACEHAPTTKNKRKKRADGEGKLVATARPSHERLNVTSRAALVIDALCCS